MEITKQQIETLKGKCPECKGTKFKKIAGISYPCNICFYTGQATIEIEKECICEHSIYNHLIKEDCEYDNCHCVIFNSKYKVGDEIRIIIDVNEIYPSEDTTITITKKTIKLKIISETEDKLIAVEVR